MIKSLLKETVDIQIKDNIVTIKLPPDTEIDLETAREIVNKRKELFPNQKIAILLNITTVKSVSKEARRFFASKQSQENLLAGAFISDLIYHKILYNFFITFYKPHVPTGFFSSEKAAQDWLSEFNKNI